MIFSLSRFLRSQNGVGASTDHFTLLVDSAVRLLWVLVRECVQMCVCVCVCGYMSILPLLSSQQEPGFLKKTHNNQAAVRFSLCVCECKSQCLGSCAVSPRGFFFFLFFVFSNAPSQVWRRVHVWRVHTHVPGCFHVPHRVSACVCVGSCVW